MPAPSRGHLGERGGEPGGAAVLQRLDEAALDELELGLDQLLAGERVADLDGRPLLVRSSPSSWLASTHAPPIPSRPVVAPKRTTRCPVRARARARDAVGGEQARRTSR